MRRAILLCTLLATFVPDIAWAQVDAEAETTRHESAPARRVRALLRAPELGPDPAPFLACGPGAEQALITIAATEPALRRRALRRLAHFDSPVGTEFLIRTLDDESPLASRAAYLALAERLRRRDEARLRRIAVEQLAHARHWEVRREAVETLAQLGDRAALRDALATEPHPVVRRALRRAS